MRIKHLMNKNRRRPKLNEVWKYTCPLYPLDETVHIVKQISHYDSVFIYPTHYISEV